MHLGVVSISQGPGHREMEYTTPAIAVREPNPKGEGERNTANRSAAGRLPSPHNSSPSGEGGARSASDGACTTILLELAFCKQRKHSCIQLSASLPTEIN